MSIWKCIQKLQKHAAEDRPLYPSPNPLFPVLSFFSSSKIKIHNLNMQKYDKDEKHLSLNLFLYLTLQLKREFATCNKQITTQ